MASVVDIHIVPLSDHGTAKTNADPRRMSKQSAGSGIIIASDGLILTNEHVVRDAAKVSVALSDGSRHQVTDVAVHPKLDLAVLRIDRHNLLALGVVGPPVEPGATVAAIGGASFLEDGAVRDGIVTHTRVSLQHALDPRRTRLYNGLIETTARIEPGFSGGALIDSHGKLVGINVAVSGDPDSKQYRGYAIPCRAPIRQAIAELVDQIRNP
ncbi:MAG: serine protease [Phycisphaerales bacterium]|nr:MAG: serine protease [Phycisphaerales bacterium]